MVKFPPVPQEVKPIAHLLKLADEHEDRNIVVTYWARMAACLLALRLVPKHKSPETAELLRNILDWLEEAKKTHGDNEGIMNETAAQALIEEYALKIFASADQQDRAEIFNKNTVKLFYTAGMLMDVLEQFGTLEDDIREKRKYAKWKAAYIHNCLKAGETPLSGPPKEFDDATGIVPNSMVSEDELKTYTKFQEPGGSDSPSVSGQDTSPENKVLYLPSKPAEEPITFPITPTTPSEPTPFSPPPAFIPAPVLNPVKSLTPTENFVPTPEQIQKAQKFCKFAASALNYDDVANALENIKKAMNLLQTGKEE